MTILCAEPHRPSACCVEDALVARGWSVALETGTAVRPTLARLLRAADPGLIVLCVPEPVDATTAARIRARLDPEGRIDLHVVSIETPRSVIEAVERLAGTRPRRVRRPGRPRSVLAHPTLVEQEVGPGRSGWFAFGVAATLVLGALGLDARPRPEPPLRHAEAMQASEPRASTLVDDAVLSAAVVVPADDDADDRRTMPATHRRVHVRSRSPKRPQLDLALDDTMREEPADVASLEPAPLEEALSSSPSRVVEVPGIRKPYVLDPFADDLD